MPLRSSVVIAARRLRRRWDSRGRCRRVARRCTTLHNLFIALDRKAFAAALGFTREVSPCCTTLHNLFIALDRKAFERSIRRWTAGRVAAGWRSVSLDGKTLRGVQGHQVPGVHLLAAYAHEARTVLDQIPVDTKTNEHKTALELLDPIPLEGKVVVGDAAFCQRDLSRKIRKKGGTGSGR